MANSISDTVVHGIRSRTDNEIEMQTSSKLLQCHSLIHQYYSSLEVSLATVESDAPFSKPWQVLTVSRKMELYRKESGPVETVRVVIDCQLHYTAYTFNEMFVEGNMGTPHEVEELPFLKKMGDVTWFICHGVDNFSSYKVFSCKDVVVMSVPPDTVRHKLCYKLLKVVDKTSRTREYNKLSVDDQLRRQSVHSTVSIDYLSPASRCKRLKNLRGEIECLRQKLRSSSKAISVELRDEQSEEMAQIVQCISSSDVGQSQLEAIYQEAAATGEGRGLHMKHIWESDLELFFNDQQQNVTGKRGNKWSSVTICIALAIFSRIPSAFRALRSLGILNLPCDATVRGYMYQHCSNPGINEISIQEYSERYEKHIQDTLMNGGKLPLKKGVLIWDETKVQSKIIWNSADSSITGFAISSEDMSSLHDVYQGLDDEEECHKTE